MNGQRLANKVSQDAVKVKKDLSTLVGDGAARVGKFGENVNQATGKAKEDLSTWVEGSVDQLSEEIEKLAGDAKETVVGAAATVKKEVRHGLSQYNAKAQEVADRVPGGFGEKAARYPWVALSIALGFGLLMGFLLRPVRRLPSQFQI